MAKRPVSKSKAREILEHGEVRGHPLTKKQRGLFGALAGGSPLRKFRSPDRYADDRPMVEPPRTEYHAQQEGLEESSKQGTPAGGTENLRVTTQTKQAAQPTSPSGSKNKWPAGVDSYTDGEV